MSCLDSAPTISSLTSLGCDRDESCPVGYVCIEGVDGEVCVSTNTEAPGICGDGVISGDEVCDNGSQNQNTYSVEEGCREDCSGPSPSCGDGIIQQADGEECDDGNRTVERCAPGESRCFVCGVDCRRILSGCGDGILDVAVGEVCDDGDIMDWRGGCLGDCSGPTLCADGSTHLGSCSPTGALSAVEGPFIVTGYKFTCAVGEDGLVECWGDNEFGQADPSDGLGPILGLAAGTNHACALRRDGTVRCWGNHQYGQTEVPTELVGGVRIAGGAANTCVVQATGKLQCWGDDQHGQVALAAEVDAATDVAVGYGHICSLNAAGDISCWGDNSMGQAEVPADLGPVVAVSAGYAQTCTLAHNGKVRCWGDNTYGQVACPPIWDPLFT